MTDAVVTPGEFRDIYRFSFVLCNDAATAGEIFDQCFQEVVKKPVSDPHHAFITLILDLRKRLLQKVKPVTTDEGTPLAGDLSETAVSAISAASSDQVLTALHRLTEPERSAYTLWHLDLLEPHDLAKLLGLTDEALSLTLQSARLELSHILSNSVPA